MGASVFSSSKNSMARGLEIACTVTASSSFIKGSRMRASLSLNITLRYSPCIDSSLHNSARSSSEKCWGLAKSILWHKNGESARRDQILPYTPSISCTERGHFKCDGVRKQARGNSRMDRPSNSHPHHRIHAVPPTRCLPTHRSPSGKQTDAGQHVHLGCAMGKSHTEQKRAHCNAQRGGFSGVGHDHRHLLVLLFD